jgi:CubicO group peptidase (beta-lactamase class C family)
MMLYEQGKFGLDDGVHHYLPAFGDMTVLRPNAKSLDDVESAESPMTIRQLLSHSAGLSYGFVEPESMIDQAYNAAGLGGLGGTEVDLAAYTDAVANLPLAYQPGSNWRYSVATDICGRLIEVLSGKRLDQAIDDLLLQPLGMADTGFHVKPENRDRLCTLYAPLEPFKPMQGGLQAMPASADFSADERPRFLSGGGGMVSTLHDYARFIQMIVNQGQWQGHQYLLPETLQLMRENQLAEGVSVNFPFWPMPGTVFGLGFAVKQKPDAQESKLAVNEYHWGGLLGTHSWIAPEAGVSGLCFTQRMPGFWHPFSHEFKHLVYAAAEAGL